MGKNILIIGLGLIGGSLGLALKDSPGLGIIMGSDMDKESLEKALSIGAVDKIVSLEEGVPEAEIIFLCTPLGTYKGIIDQIKPFLKPGCLISDVGSTKLDVMRLFDTLPPGVFAIGGHPMAGAETQGINGADRYLFENAVYILTPRTDTPPEVQDMLIKILGVSGARMEIMDARIHDQVVATVSHIPHLAAVALVQLTEGSQQGLMMAAGGFRDTTRVASSNPNLWEDIVFSNKVPLLEQLDGLIGRLAIIKDALQNDDRECLRRELQSAKDIRDSLPRIRKALIPSCYDLVCIVPDKPGIIARLGSILYGEGINIVDIEILRAREGDGGSIRLGVPTQEMAEKAVEALQAQGIKSWLR